MLDNISHAEEFAVTNIIQMSNLVDILRPAAEEGDIDLLYTVLKDNPSILEDIDSKQLLVETPLHIAASKGHIPFAIEIMNWKPSFALKLNPEGLSPIHLAIQNKNLRMVMCFVDMNKELVRVKGKRGWTPLHLASEIGDVDILAKLVLACPDSIKDVTVKGQSALHIAAKNDNYDALHFLVYFLRVNTRRGSGALEYKILNQKDDLDNTILHISAEKINIPKEIIQLLLKTTIKLNAKNSESKTALDMATGAEIIKLLSSAGEKRFSELTDFQKLGAMRYRFITKWDEVEIRMSRAFNFISEETRNATLIIVTLVITATYQSVLSPPGGLYQANAASDNNVNMTASSNSTISSLGTAGKSVLSKNDFLVFSLFSMGSFFWSLLIIIIMTPREGMVLTMCGLMSWFTINYLYSIVMIAPASYTLIYVDVFSFISEAVVYLLFTILMYSIVQRLLRARKLKRSALLQSNTEIDTNTLPVQIGERNINEDLSPDI